MRLDCKKPDRANDAVRTATYLTSQWARHVAATWRRQHLVRQIVELYIHVDLAIRSLLSSDSREPTLRILSLAIVHHRIELAVPVDLEERKRDSYARGFFLAHGQRDPRMAGTLHPTEVACVSLVFALDRAERETSPAASLVHKELLEMRVAQRESCGRRRDHAPATGARARPIELLGARPLLEAVHCVLGLALRDRGHVRPQAAYVEVVDKGGRILGRCIRQASKSEIPARVHQSYIRVRPVDIVEHLRTRGNITIDSDIPVTLPLA